LFYLFLQYVAFFEDKKYQRGLSRFVISELSIFDTTLARDIIILLKSSIKLSIKKTPKVAAKGVFCACSRHSG